MGYPKSTSPIKNQINNTNQLLETLETNFDQLRIAGHFHDSNNNLHAIYLDEDNLYTNRTEQEEAVFSQVSLFANSSSPKGKWISVVGNAGHGKSCFLWHIYQKLKIDPRFVVLPYLGNELTNDKNLDEIKQHLNLLQTLNNDQHIVILIDTLDILVGVDNSPIANSIKYLKNSCLLITTSRLQEAEQVYRYVQRDIQISLAQYTTEEFEIITRKYIDKCYLDWNIEQKERQFSYISNLLEQQRNIKELDLEPLILRMIFEVYAPNDIPPDINTQQVYKKFWYERVESDRLITNSEAKTRKQICRLIARELAFGNQTSNSESLTYKSLLNANSSLPTFDQIPTTTLEKSIETLVSSGVIQWIEKDIALKFFHQTFFEYAAAFDLLCLILENISLGKEESLIEDIKRSILFKAPIFKQLILQSYYKNLPIWQEFILRLYKINNELAAQLILEIIGKIKDSEFSIKHGTQWINNGNNNIVKQIICNIVRSYPKKRIPIALEFLQYYVKTSIQNSIYAFCKDSSILAPDIIHKFLHQQIENVKPGDINTKTIYKDALCETLRFGQVGALDDLADLFSYLSDGQREGLLRTIVTLITETNLESIALFLKNHIFEILARKKGGANIWEEFANIFFAIHKINPVIVQKHIQPLLDNKRWNHHENTASYLGKIAGRITTDKITIQQAILNLSSSDNLFRMFNAGFLYESNQQNSEFIIDFVLSFNILDEYKTKEYVSSLYHVVSAFNAVGIEKIFQFLDSWPPIHGSGEALRRIFTKLSEVDSTKTKDWLLAKLRNPTNLSDRSYWVIFEILAKADIKIFTKEDLQETYKIANESSSENQRLFISVTGNIAIIDKNLAKEIVTKVFTQSSQEWHTALIMSLENCLPLIGTFVVQEIPDIIAYTFSTKRIQYLQGLFKVLKKFPQQQANDLLECLNTTLTKVNFSVVEQEGVITQLIDLLNLYAYYNPEQAFSITKLCNQVSNVVSDALIKLYKTISKHTDNAQILVEILGQVKTIITRPGSHSDIRNNLAFMMQTIDRKLGENVVVNMILSTYPLILSDDVMEDFFEAAVNIDSWTTNYANTILQTLDNNKFPKARSVFFKIRN